MAGEADLILAIDEGTSSARAVVYDADWAPVATAARRLSTAHPRPGWAEQDPDAIVDAVTDVVAEVLDAVDGPTRIAAAGLANQGETVVAWDRVSGAALAPAVLWSCRRSQPIVDRVEAAGHGPEIRRRTGLPLDPYFSASKLRWLIEEVPAVARATAAGRVAFGTVDAWLTARLDATDAPNGDAAQPRGSRTDPSTASRTQLLTLAGLAWDGELARIWAVPREALPPIVPTVGNLGALTHQRWGGPIPLRAMACDQQAALAGQGGHRSGTVKATLGSGVFVLANAGSVVPDPPDGILATVAWQGASGLPTYALDGGVFSAGTLLDWLHAGLGILDAPAHLDAVAAAAPDPAGVRILPALAGLGAPWWEPAARVVVAGMSAATGRAEVARAAIDAIAQRTADVVEAMAPALPDPAGPLRLDGGLSGSALLVQRVADLVGRPVDVARDPESTALGTALLAAIGAGRIDEAAAAAVVATGRRVTPALDETSRRAERDAWADFVRLAIRLAPSAPPA